MITRRSLIPRLALLGVGGLAVWAVRDRIPWPPLRVEFEEGSSSPWIPIAGRALIEIPARVNGTPIRAVVDSGAQFSAIDRGLARRLQIPQTAALPLLAYGVSGQPDLTYTVKFDLGLPGLAVHGLRAAALEIARLSAATGRDFSLLIGRDVLRRLVIDADFPGERVRFLARDAFQPPSDAVAVPLRLTGGAPVTPVQIEDAPPVEVLVDTGATGALALSAEAARQAGLLAPGRPVLQARSVSLGGLGLDRVVIARNVSLAGLRFPRTPVQIYSPSVRGAVPPGLLGTGILGRFRMGLDVGGARLFLVRPAPLVVRRRR